MKPSNSGGLGKVLTFFSISSAVGKSVAAINAAAYLAQRDYRVCLIDGDLQFGDISRYIKLNPSKTIYDFYAAGKDADASDFVVPTAYKFDCLACPREIDEAWLIEPDTVAKAIGQLRHYYDYILVDTITGFSSLNTAILEQVDTLYFLFVVDFVPSIKNMKSGIDALRRLSYDTKRVRLVLNRADAKTQISIKDVESILNRPFDYFISNDFEAFMYSLRQGRPAILADKASKAAEEMGAMMADEIGDAAKGKSGGFSSWLGKLWG